MEAVQSFLDEFELKLKSDDSLETILQLFNDCCYWRDFISFTWNIKTMEGKEEIKNMLKASLIRPFNWKVTSIISENKEDNLIESWISFETDMIRGCGILRLRDNRIYTILTTTTKLKGYEEHIGFNRPLGANHGNSNSSHKTWKEQRQEEMSTLGYETQPFVVIIGGGQAGIALGARLRQLNVPTIIIEKNKRIGDSWRNRYKSLCLHDPVWYCHFPYIDFPTNWPIFTPKDKIGDWMEMYSVVNELICWTNSTVKSASFNQTTKEWTVVIDRDGKQVNVTPKHLVFATGQAGKANIPKLLGNELFQGISIVIICSNYYYIYLY